VAKHLEDFGVAESECMPYELGKYYEVSPSISDYLLGDSAVCRKFMRFGFPAVVIFNRTQQSVPQSALSITLAVGMQPTITTLADTMELATVRQNATAAILILKNLKRRFLITEADMIKELQDGPITVGFWASQDLIFYKSGVWRHNTSVGISWLESWAELTFDMPVAAGGCHAQRSTPVGED
jgi:hypothetical protein